MPLVRKLMLRACESRASQGSSARSRASQRYDGRPSFCGRAGGGAEQAGGQGGWSVGLQGVRWPRGLRRGGAVWCRRRPAEQQTTAADACCARSPAQRSPAQRSAAQRSAAQRGARRSAAQPSAEPGAAGRSTARHRAGHSRAQPAGRGRPGAHVVLRGVGGEQAVLAQQPDLAQARHNRLALRLADHGGAAGEVEGADRAHRGLRRGGRERGGGRGEPRGRRRRRVAERGSRAGTRAPPRAPPCPQTCSPRPASRRLCHASHRSTTAPGQHPPTVTRSEGTPLARSRPALRA